MMLAVEFGSKGRGDSDIFSDSDILLVGREWKDIERTKELYSSQGYSVTSFNFQRAIYLSEKGSLFLKHIIDEGNVVAGEEKEFLRLKNIWTPKYRYDDEIEDNIDLLEVLSYLPKNHYGLLVCIDILINSVRNILIRKLASFGIFTFSWESIFSHSLGIGFIKTSHIPTLRYARRIKNAYRTGHYCLNTLNIFLDLIIIARYCIDCKIKVNFADREVLSLPEKCTEGSYKQLRAIEILCAYYEFDQGMEPYYRAVKDPNYFCTVGLTKILGRGTTSRDREENLSRCPVRRLNV